VLAVLGTNSLKTSYMGQNSNGNSSFFRVSQLVPPTGLELNVVAVLLFQELGGYGR